MVARLRSAGIVFADEEAALLVEDAKTPADLDAMVESRCTGRPLEHVLGWAAFAGLRVAVTEGVFVPRRRCEHLAHEAAALAGPGAVVVDLCCGTGAVGLYVAHAVPGIELHAVDVDPAACRCARDNLAGRGRVHQGDLFAPLPASLRERVDVLVANVPYVPTSQLPLLPAEARVHESRLALEGGADGLDVLRRLAGQTGEWLRPGGHLLVETSAAQAREALTVLASSGLVPRVVRSEELSATVVHGQRPG